MNSIEACNSCPFAYLSIWMYLDIKLFSRINYWKLDIMELIRYKNRMIYQGSLYQANYCTSTESKLGTGYISCLYAKQTQIPSVPTLYQYNGGMESGINIVSLSLHSISMLLKY